MAGPNETPAGADEQLAAAEDHIDTRVIEKWAGHFFRAAHPYVVPRISAAAAASVSGQKVIPAIAIDHVGGLAVDREIAGLIARVQTFARFRIQLDQPDIAEIRAVNQPQPAVV